MRFSGIHLWVNSQWVLKLLFCIMSSKMILLKSLPGTNELMCLVIIIIPSACLSVTCMFSTEGDHGYNNSLASMHPIFLARGPQFRRGFQSGPLRNVDVYPLICKLLVMDPHANDGDLSRIQHLLREHGEEGEEGFFHLDLTLITCKLQSAHSSRDQVAAILHISAIKNKAALV